MKPALTAKLLGSWCLAWSGVACESTLPASFDGLSCDPGGRCLAGYVCDDATLMCVRPDRTASVDSVGGSSAKVADPGDDDSAGGGNASNRGGAGGVSAKGGAEAVGGKSSGNTAGRSSGGAPTSGGAPVTMPDCGDKTWCDGSCVDLKRDATNCGKCGQACAAPLSGTAICDNSVCTFNCQDGRKKCDDACVDTKTDAANCGHCGTVCEGGPNGTAACSDGACKLVCNAGFSLCTDKCLDTGSDSKNCGKCGHKCPEEGNCALGICVPG